VSRCGEGAGTREWADPARVSEFLGRELPHRQGAERELLDALPHRVERVLDLGTGDGRLIALIRGEHPGAHFIGLDSSPPMLARAAERFGVDASVALRDHDLEAPLELDGDFDAVVSALAIHHLSDERKRSLYGEAHALLRPGGAFANLDLVTSASAREHARFRAAIGRVQDDPGDRLAELCAQLQWLRAAGFDEVDCRFKWLELALLVGVKT
jgi:SAM-dependent methyltransferase